MDSVQQIYVTKLSCKSTSISHRWQVKQFYKQFYHVQYIIFDKRFHKMLCKTFFHKKFYIEQQALHFYTQYVGC